jgi:hypothetical protein
MTDEFIIFTATANSRLASMALYAHYQSARLGVEGYGNSQFKNASFA